MAVADEPVGVNDTCCDADPVGQNQCLLRRAYRTGVERAYQEALQHWFEEHYDQLASAGVPGLLPSLAERLGRHRANVERIRKGQNAITEKMFAVLRQVFHTLEHDPYVGQGGKAFRCREVAWPDPDNVHLYGFCEALNTRAAAWVEEVLTVHEVEARLGAFLQARLKPAPGAREALAAAVAGEVRARLAGAPAFLRTRGTGNPPTTFKGQVDVHRRLAGSFRSVNLCLRDLYGELI